MRAIGWAVKGLAIALLVRVVVAVCGDATSAHTVTVVWRSRKVVGGDNGGPRDETIEMCECEVMRDEMTTRSLPCPHSAPPPAVQCAPCSVRAVSLPSAAG